MMFKQILSYREILDLSIKKTNLCEIFSASKFSRVSELLNNSDNSELNVVEVDLREAYAFGGGLHCSTADVYREGKLEDYFPNQ